MIDRLVIDAARDCPDAPFVIGSPRSHTYADAARLIPNLAGVLQQRGINRLALHAADSSQLVLMLCACAAADIEVCVLNHDWPPTEVASTLQRLNLPTLVADSNFSHAIPLDSLFADAARAAPITGAADARLLILTSGTTGAPKAARYTWQRLIAQAKIAPRWRGTRWLMAYHLNHFAGLHLLAHVLANRAAVVIPASPSIADAITAISQHDVTCVSATPTFWRSLLAQLDRDAARALPLQQITLGGEAVPPGLVERLHDAFPSARISQVFATTESGSALSVRDARDGLPAALLDASPSPIRVVDGELHVRADHGMLGYVGDDAAPPLHDGYWPTGDLVERRGDRLHFVGRKSDVINVGGVKVHPLPIEQLIASLPGVAAARCYGRKNPVTGQIVALDVVPDANADRQQLEAAIHDAAAAALPRHSQPRLVRFVDALDIVNRKVMRRSEPT